MTGSRDGSVVVRPLTLFGDRRRRVLEERTRQAAEEWSRRWIARAPDAVVSVEIAVPSSQPAAREVGTRCFGVRDAGGSWLALCSVPSRLAPWAAGSSPADVPLASDLEDSSLSASLDLAIVNGFWGLLVPGAFRDEAREVGAIDTRRVQDVRASMPPGSAQLRCTFDAMPNVVVEWVLAAPLISELVRERGRPFQGESLTSRRSAVTDAAVHLECVLGAIHMQLRDLRSLRQGDVVVTDVPLDALAEIQFAGRSQRVMRGSLGEAEGRRAIRIEHEPRGASR